VIEVSVSEDDRVQLLQRDGEGLPIPETERFKSLKEAAVD
jgi:hypothetical protein